MKQSKTKDESMQRVESQSPLRCSSPASSEIPPDHCRKVVHEVEIEWIKERVSLEQLSWIFGKGVDNPSDLSVWEVLLLEVTEVLWVSRFPEGLLQPPSGLWLSLRFFVEKFSCMSSL